MEYCLYVHVYRRLNGKNDEWIDGDNKVFGYNCITTSRNEMFDKKRELEAFFSSKYNGQNIQILSVVDFITDDNQHLLIEGSTEKEMFIHRQKEYEYLNNECILPIDFKPKLIPYGSQIYEVLPDFVPPRKSSYLGVKMKI